MRLPQRKIMQPQRIDRLPTLELEMIDRISSVDSRPSDRSSLTQRAERGEREHSERYKKTQHHFHRSPNPKNESLRHIYITPGAQACRGKPPGVVELSLCAAIVPTLAEVSSPPKPSF